MVVRFPKKVRKMRGWRTHGYGRISQHRKSGQRGGKGHAGLKKHLKSWAIKNRPNYFGKYGFKRPLEVSKSPNSINLREVDKILRKMITEKTKAKSQIYKVDLSQFGYQKLLSKGFLSAPAEIIVGKATESAIKKVESYGGKVITPQK